MGRLQDLKDFIEKRNQYSRAITLLYWDMETCTPKNGLDKHVDAVTFFSTEVFKMNTSEEIKNILDDLSKEEEYAQLDDTWKFIVKKMKEDVDKSRRIPQDVYTEFVRLQSEAGNVWREAKQTNDYKLFAPYLQKLVDMAKTIIGYTDPGKEVYNVLLDQHEEGMDSETIDRLFDDMKKELIPLVKAIVEAKQPDDTKFKGYYDPDAQRKVQKLLLEYIGFNFESGAVGETEHPFTTNFDSKDVRVTNHYFENDGLSAIYTAIHEGGHAIFEQNVNPEFDGTVAGSCSNMGLHESQSRFFENILGRNINFWKPIYEKVADLLPKYKEITLDEFYHEINHVRNSLIRVDADELTYCFHIIIRYEIEKAIFREGVSVDELPRLWNEKMQEYLQITPDTDADGILQDVHWSGASFGYFPTYLLGSIYDGMYLETIEEELGSVDEILAAGDIQKITKWLNEKIHVYGSTRTPKDTIASVCGKEVSAQPIIKHFKKKYTELYKL